VAVLFRVTHLGVTSAVALLRLMAMSHRAKTSSAGASARDRGPRTGSAWREDPARGKVRNGRVVAGAPGIWHRFAVGADPQVGQYDQHSAPVNGQVGVAAHHGVRVVADGPHDQVGVELLAGR